MFLIKQNDEKLTLLLSSIQILPPDTARVIQLYYYRKLSLKEICVIMDKSISTVRNHHNRGIFLLKKHLRKSQI
jgi:RNA polymerase sigma factor (sigma-70 family)